MTRAGASWVVAGSTAAGLVLGVVGSRLATKPLGDTGTRANVVLVATFLAGALGAGIASYATSGKQLTA